MKRITTLLRWLNVLLIISTFLAYLSPYINPASFWPISVFGLGFPYLFILNFCFAILWAMMRQRYFWLSVGCLVMGWGHFTAQFGWSGNGDLGKETINVVNYNTRNFRYIYMAKKNAAKREKSFNTWLASAAVDIFLLQETDPSRVKKITAATGFKHSYQPKGKRVAILSKYPIMDSGFIDFGHASHAVIWADIKCSGRIVRCYSIHLKSSYLNREAIDAVSSGKVKEKETWTGLWGLIKSYKNYGYQRIEQAEKLLAHIQDSSHPVIVGGDFNEPPTSYIYHQFSKYLKDGFVEAGSGIGSTYNGKIPFLKIDYLFLSPNIKILSQKIDRVPFSDHFPVRTVIEVK